MYSYHKYFTIFASVLYRTYNHTFGSSFSIRCNTTSHNVNSTYQFYSNIKHKNTHTRKKKKRKKKRKENPQEGIPKTQRKYYRSKFTPHLIMCYLPYLYQYVIWEDPACKGVKSDQARI